MPNLSKYNLTSIELCNTGKGILTLLFVLRIIGYYSLTAIQTMIKTKYMSLFSTDVNNCQFKCMGHIRKHY